MDHTLTINSPLPSPSPSPSPFICPTFVKTAHSITNPIISLEFWMPPTPIFYVYTCVCVLMRR